jgi:hypothetical protein
MISHLVKQNPKIELGLGTIATGVLENEPILSPLNLTRDVQIAKDLGIETVTIFRLGGLTKEYTLI